MVARGLTTAAAHYAYGVIDPDASGGVGTPTSFYVARARNKAKKMCVIAASASFSLLLPPPRSTASWDVALAPHHWRSGVPKYHGGLC
jgi:hypothetical protein